MSDPAAPTRVCPLCHTQSRALGPRCPNCGKKFKKGGFLSKLLIAAVVFVILIAVLVSSCRPLVDVGGNGAVDEFDKRAARTEKGAVGEDIENAGLTYKVTSARTTNQVGDTAYGQKPKQGATFVVVDMILTNDKDETTTFSEDAGQIRADGETFQTARYATVSLGEKSLILNDVRPGIATRRSVVFMVPIAALPAAKLVIHDPDLDGKIELDLGL